MADEPLPARLFEAGAAPPFLTADGARVEIEVLRADAWGRFWGALGADPEDARRGWQPYLFKHSTAACPLPDGLRDAAARRPLADLLAAAAAAGAAVRRLRSYPEVLADAGRDAAAPWAISAPPVSGGPGRRRQEDREVRAGATPELPLSGLRVLEATTRVQGPLAGLLLRMLGADVSRLELPGGDPGRGFPPFVAGRGAVFVAYNEGKRTVEADYHTPAGRRSLRELAASADVFVHNWRTGRAEELGLAHRDLAADNPGLVYCHAGGWGHAGLADGLTPAGEAPRPTRLTLVDVLGALVACEGILAALLARERTGRGARVDTSLASAARDAQAHVLEAMTAGREARRRSGRPLAGPFDRPLATGAGELVVAVEDEAGLRRLAGACGLPAGPGGPADPALAIAGLLRGRPAAEWERLLGERDVWAAAVRTDLRALPRDPIVGRALRPVDGGCWLPAAPWRFLP